MSSVLHSLQQPLEITVYNATFQFAALDNKIDSSILNNQHNCFIEYLILNFSKISLFKGPYTIL
jgi:hypothetical protein